MNSTAQLGTGLKEQEIRRPPEGGAESSTAQGVSVRESPFGDGASLSATSRGPELDAGIQGLAAKHLPARMLYLQRTLGNKTISALIQRRLRVSDPGDPYEQQADQVAKWITTKGAPAQKPLLAGVKQIGPENQMVERSGDDRAPTVSSDFESRLSETKQSGSPLPQQVREYMEPRFGADLRDVRVHTDTRAHELSQAVAAQAFTHGRDIYFGAGHSPTDSELTAHELTHVIQQGSVVRRQVLPAEAAGGAMQSGEAPVEDGVPAAEPPAREPAVGRSEAVVEEENAFRQETGQNTQSVSDKMSLSAELSPMASPPGADADSRSTDSPLEPGGDAKALTTPGVNTSELENHANDSGFRPGTDFDSVARAQGETGAPRPAESLDAHSLPHAGAGEGSIEPNVSSGVGGLHWAPAGSPTMDQSDARSGTPPVQPATNILQRSEEDEEGLLAGIRRRISSIVDGLSTGWDQLSQMAQSAYNGVRELIGSGVEALGNLASSAISGIQSGWSRLTEMGTQMTNGVKQQLQAGIGAVTGAVQGVAQAVTRLDASGLRAAWGRVTGLIGSIWERLQQAGQAVLQRLTSLWSGLLEGFNSLTRRISEGARALLSRLNSAIQAIGQRLSAAWNGLQQRAAQLSDVLGSVLERLRGLLNRFLSWAEQTWTAIQRQWNVLGNQTSGFLQQMSLRISAAWQALTTSATAAWNGIKNLWTRFQGWVREQVQSVLGSLGALWNSVRRFSISDLINVIVRCAPFLEAVREAFENPDSVLRPLAQAITSRIDAGMPAAAEQQARERATGNSAVPSSGQTLTTADASLSRDDDVVIHRQPLSQPLEQPLGQSTIWGAFLEGLLEKWHQFWQNPVDNILHMLWEMVAFWETVPRDFRGLISDLENVGHRMVAAGMGFWRHLLDVPLVIWRRVNQILFDLYPLFLLLSVVVGAIAGGVGGTVGGAILSFMAGGAGAAPGAGVGIAGGAGIGLGFALGVGKGLLISYLAAEGLSFVKAWADLTLVEQTEEEQVEDLNQMVASAIGLGIALLLLALSAIGGAIARNLLSKLRLQPGGAAQRFLQGVRAGMRGGDPFQRWRKRPAKAPEEPEPEPPRPVIEVDAANLRASEPVYQNGRWEWYLYDDVSKARFCEIYAEGPSPSAQPEGGPRLTLTPKEAVLPDGTTVTLKAKGFSWTPESLRLAIDSYQRRFGVRPPELGGEIDWSNLENFQWEYADIRAKNPGMAQEQIGIEAARRISFGKHRMTVGYGDLRARMSNFVDVTLRRTIDGVPQDVTLHDVPKDVYIEARPTPESPAPGSPTTGNASD